MRETRSQRFTSGGVGFNYGPLGRLYQVVRGTEIRRFLYATGDTGLPEAVGDYDGAGNLLDSYGFGPGPDEPVLWWDIAAGAAFRTLQADERGSIIAAADGFGNLVAINKYDEYGVPQGTVTGAFGYTGQLAAGGRALLLQDADVQPRRCGIHAA